MYGIDVVQYRCGTRLEQVEVNVLKDECYLRCQVDRHVTLLFGQCDSLSLFFLSLLVMRVTKVYSSHNYLLVTS